MGHKRRNLRRILWQKKDGDTYIEQKYIWIHVKAHSHYCIFHMSLRQMVVFLQGDRKFPISALLQLTMENEDRCIKCESAFRQIWKATEYK